MNCELLAKIKKQNKTKTKQNMLCWPQVENLKFWVGRSNLELTFFSLFFYELKVTSSQKSVIFY